jgi:hypothetical protein
MSVAAEAKNSTAIDDHAFQRNSLSYVPQIMEREDRSGDDADDADRPADPVQYREVHGISLRS